MQRLIKSKQILLILLLSGYVMAQKNVSDSILIHKNIKFRYEALIIPTVLIGYGAIGLESHTLKGINSGTRNELKEHIEKLTIDDISQYTPFLPVCVLNAVGIKGRNNFKDRFNSVFFNKMVFCLCRLKTSFF